jgi:UDP-glucose 4-epimerase
VRIAVTGVAGFLGSHLAERLLQLGHTVVGIDNLIGGYRRNVPTGVDFQEFDLLDLEKTTKVFNEVELVVHGACTAYEGLSVFSPSLVAANTFQITANVMSASVKNHVRKVIFMSSMARYGEQEVLPFREFMIPKPQDPYGIAKLAAEQLVINLSEIHGLEYSILVPHNIIGPRQKYDDPFRNVASIMINRMLMGKQPIIYGTGNQKRCFSFINDVVNPLITACLSDDANGRVINIGPDEEFISINELSSRIARILNFELLPIYLDERPQEVKLASCSADLARELLGYRTSTSLDKGLEELINWIKEMGPKPFEYHIPLEFITSKTPKTWSQRIM